MLKIFLFTFQIIVVINAFEAFSKIDPDENINESGLDAVLSNIQINEPSDFGVRAKRLSKLFTISIN